MGGMPGCEWFAPPGFPCKRRRLWRSRHAQDGILRSDLTVNIALFLSSDGIALAHRQPAGHWAMIGETALDVPDLSAALADLRTLAAERESEDFEALLVLPDDQILYTSLTAPTADPELTAFRIEEGLDGLTPYAVTELEYDWRVLEEDRVKIAVCARETLDEARGFAAQYGFVGKGFAAMPPMERFPGVPTFDLGAEADEMGFTAEGIAFGPDAFGMPEVEPEPSPEPEPTPEPVPSPVPEAAETPVEPEPVPETVEALAEPETEVAEEPAPEPAADPTSTQAQEPADQNPALAEALMAAAQATAALEAEEPAPTPVQAIEDPSVSGPISAIASDTSAGDAPESAAAAVPQETVGDAGDEDDLLPPAPSPASLEARQRARVIRGEPSGSSDASPPSGTAGQFAARRGPTAAPDGANRPLTAPEGSGRPIAAPEGARGSLVGQRSSRLGLAHPDGPPRAAPSVAPEAPDASSPPPAAPADGTPMPRLAEQLQRVRNASKSRPSGATGAPPPRPRVEIDPQPALGATGVAAERRPSPFDDPPASASSPSKRGGGLAAALGRGDPAAPAPSSDEDAPAKSRFLRRRKGGAVAAPAPQAAEATDGDEIFSSGLLARKSVKPTGGSFKTGLVLTIILLLLLALVAIWSAVFLPNSPVARLLGMGEPAEQVAASSGLPAPNVVSSAPVIGTADVQPSLEDEAAADGLDLAAVEESSEPEAVVADVPVTVEVAAAAPAVEPALPDIDAELDLPPLPVIDQGLNPSVEEAEALYAEDGIWARSPERPDLRPFDLLDRVYTASIDPEVSAFDAVALPDPGVNPGELLRRFPPPPAFGAEFDLTASGLISPTPEGVLTPEGAFVIAGPPPFAAVPRPREIASETPAVIDVDDAVLGTFRPSERPGDLSETRERQILGGLTQVELGERRPAARPASPQEAAAQASLFPGGDGAADPDAVDAAVELALAGTDLAVSRSLMPRTRPGNIAQIVASADRTPIAPPTAVAAEAVAAGPAIPSNADVSRAATERNAIRLRNVNLIGVSGTPSDRRGLVRLSSGRFVRVSVGDRLDGGRVAAIGETTLQYVRSGRTVTLEIPG